MFQSLFRRAEVAIEQSIGQLMVRVLTAVPFVIAAAYGTSALSLRLDRAFDPETSRLIMSGLFLGVGLLAALVVAIRSPRGPVAASGQTGDETGGASASASQQEAPNSISDADRDLIFAALTSAAPIAVPHLARLLLRNLPLLLAIAGAIFVMTRASPQQQASAAPAE